MRVDDFTAFIFAREAARLGNGFDPIIAKYRFCNVRREDDRVTKWIAEHWRTPHQNNKDIVFAMVVARLFNLPATLADIEFPVPWRPAFVGKKLARRKERGLNTFNAAYIVSTNGLKVDKVKYVLDYVLKPMWEARESQPGRETIWPKLEDLHTWLMQFRGMGSFMAAQVVADAKYTPRFSGALDWNTFAASGPGSRRGLNRVMDQPLKAPWKEWSWHSHLLDLREQTLKKLPRVLKNLHAQDIQNCLCEFDKYERARLGQGLPKQLYVRHEEK